MNTNKSRILRWSLIFGIVVVLNMFFSYTLSLVYHEPMYNDFCPVQYDVQPPTTEIKCSNDYNTAQNNFDRNVFIALVVLGAITVALGNFLKGNMLLGQALSLSGVLSFIIASMRYWSYAGQWLKVVILALALAVLIWVAVKKFQDN